MKTVFIVKAREYISNFSMLPSCYSPVEFNCAIFDSREKAETFLNELDYDELDNFEHLIEEWELK